MATLIFDIETVGEDWNTLDAVTQTSLSRWIRKTAKNKHDEVLLLQDLRANLGFSPLTGTVIAIGLFDRERAQGAVYYVGNKDEGDIPSGAYMLKQRTEKEMLEDFWEGAKSYDTFVSFNGRAFDVPFLLHRSVVHGVVPTRDLMDGRYISQQKDVRHVDLQDQLSFYGAQNRRGSLHLYCRAYGIESPKLDVQGDEVAQLFAQKKFKDIATYNARDVTATALLYEKWLTYLAPQSFFETEY